MQNDFENYDWENLEGKNLIPPIGAWHKTTAKWRIEPSFFIMGVQKGGTTSMATYLTQHPQIIPP
ncbi:MAG: hypothetical protein ACRCYO_08585, partial [Bacteroidia bacterium]